MANPYLAPGARITEQTEVEEYGEVGLFRNTRIGRIRYLAYGIAGSLLFAMVAVAFGAMKRTAMTNADVASLSTAVYALLAAYIGFIGFQIWLTVRRSHDFNVTGWLSVLFFIPLVNLVFIFIPGTDGANRFGPKPPPNKGATALLIVTFLLVAVIGILAAIAIPAYQGYVKRAHAAQEFGQQR